MWSHHLSGVVQERCNSIANALELVLSCTNPLTCDVTAILVFDGISYIDKLRQECNIIKKNQFGIGLYVSLILQCSANISILQWLLRQFSNSWFFHNMISWYYHRYGCCSTMETVDTICRMPSTYVTNPFSALMYEFHAVWFLPDIVWLQPIWHQQGCSEWHCHLLLNINLGTNHPPGPPFTNMV